MKSFTLTDAMDECTDFGMLIVSQLQLADLAGPVLRINKRFNTLARERIKQIWPLLQLLLSSPFNLCSASDLLLRTEVRFVNVGSDEYMHLFTLAIGYGALVNVTKLYLEFNEIGDGGIMELSHALSKGGLASLKKVVTPSPHQQNVPLRTVCCKRCIELI